ncbi:MAG: hypothetical protein ACNA7E_02160 [Wenzhouxiangellaceae bacterium]
MKSVLAAALLVLILAGLVTCQSSGPEPEGEHLLQDYEDALDRARAVEDQVKEAAERQRRAIDDNIKDQDG